MEDEKIIRLYFARDEQAIAETDRKYGRSCRAVAENILTSRQDSEECVNDTYLAAWNAIPPTYPVHLSAYLIGIVRKLSLMCLRRRYADRRGGGEYALCYEELDTVIGSSASPEDELELKELAGEIDAFLSTLSNDDRRIFMCRYWLIASVAQIAESTGFSPGKIKSSLHRSRARLKTHLAKEGLL